MLSELDKLAPPERIQVLEQMLVQARTPADRIVLEGELKKARGELSGAVERTHASDHVHVERRYEDGSPVE